MPCRRSVPKTDLRPELFGSSFDWPVRLELVSRSQVSASLGQQALDRGLLAGLAGFAIVVLFLLVFYRVLGVIASVAMSIYGLYLYAIVALIPIVLTLPGIAGMILTLGVAA